MEKVKIAIIDTGINYKEKSILQNIKFKSEIQCKKDLKDIESIYDKNDHGTLCALTMCEKKSDIELYPIKIFDDMGRASSDDLLVTLKKLRDTDINIINISASFSNLRNIVEINKVCEKLRYEGKIIVASNYNSSDGRKSVLAMNKNVIGVDKKEFIIDDNCIAVDKKEKIQIRGNGNQIFYKIEDRWVLFGGNSRLACVISAKIAMILSQNKKKIDEILNILEKKSITNINTKNQVYDIKIIKKQVINIINNNFLFDSNKFVDEEYLLKNSIINNLTIIKKHNICFFIKKIEQIYNIIILKEGLELYRIVDLEMLSILIKIKKGIYNE